MFTTAEWAASLGISIEDDAPPVEGFNEPYGQSARDVAIRALVLQGIVAVGYFVDPAPIIGWFHEQGLWDQVTPREKTFLLDRSPSADELGRARWREEAEWTLLWAIGKVGSLGLPTRCCDSRMLVDKIMPPLGSDVTEFVAGAVLRPPAVLLAEDDRTYDLYCRAVAAERRGGKLPDDLDRGVLWERRYAFEWLDGIQLWDDVTCDA